MDLPGQVMAELGSVYASNEIPTQTQVPPRQPYRVAGREIVFQPGLRARLKRLLASFQQSYGDGGPDFVARSPGRVNLIGEHIDYSNYPVLPMALSDKDILIACRVTRGPPIPADLKERARVLVANTVADRFPARQFYIDQPASSESSAAIDWFPIDASQHEWSNYFKSGMKVRVCESTD